MNYTFYLDNVQNGDVLEYSATAHSFVGCSFSETSTRSPLSPVFRMNIVMGSACNYNCKYCLQHPTMQNVPSDTRNIDELIKNIRMKISNILQSYDTVHIVFWGGEPLLYWSTLTTLIKGLSDISDKVRFGICTNGALLTENKAEWLETNKVGISLSYDGPGQYVRDNEDVLSPGTFLLSYIQNKLVSGTWSFNPVWHKGNPLMSNYIDFMNDRLKSDAWHIGDIQMNLICGDNSYNWALPEDELKLFTFDILALLYKNQAENFIHIYHKAAIRFINTLGNANAWGGCGNISGEHTLNIDLNGNLWDCHGRIGSTTGEAYLGNIKSEKVKPQFSAFMERREARCKDCVLRTICGGGCPTTPSAFDDYNCVAQWYRWFPALSLAVNILTQKQLVEISKNVG